MFRIDGALRHLIGRIPAVGIGHPRQRKAVGGGALTVAQHAVQLADIIGHVPRPVVFVGLEGREQHSVADLARARGHRALIAETAGGQLNDVLRQPVEIVDVDRAGGGEIALVRIVRALADIDRADQLREQEVDVGIALAVAMCRHVDRHAVDGDGEIGAVIEIEAAQEILVGFAFAGMLGDDQARHRLKQLATRGRARSVPRRRCVSLAASGPQSKAREMVAGVTPRGRPVGPAAAAGREFGRGAMAVAVPCVRRAPRARHDTGGAQPGSVCAALDPRGP